MLATPDRVIRPVWVGSVLVMLPEPEMVHDGKVKLRVNVPSLLVTVSVKLMFVPHTKPAEVLTWKGTVLVRVPSTGTFG